MKAIRIALIVTGLLGALSELNAGLYTNKERIGFWRKNYTILDELHSPSTATAHGIFDALVHAAGTRPGVTPQLLIIKETPYNLSLPVSLPDGGIVISQSIVDKLLTGGSEQEVRARIAFVLGHEIAHLYASDFWHMQFFRLMSQSQSASDQDLGSHQIYRSILNNRDELIEKELFADEQSLLYMVLAGFDADAVTETDALEDFFSQWNTHVARRRQQQYTPLVPEAARVNAVKARMAHIAGQSYLYKLGIQYFIAAEYDKAARLFGEYSLTFPSREVFHHLAMSYHFAAISEYTPPALINQSLPMQFSFMMDPVERLFVRTRRSATESKASYEKLIKKSIKYYEQSIQQDPDYLPAHINLATAYMGLDNVYKSVGLLMDASEKHNSSGILNNLGLAFELLEQPDKAQKYFQSALVRDKTAIEALYNLGRMRFMAGEVSAAKGFWKQYLEHDADSAFAKVIQGHLGVNDKAESGFPERELIAGSDLNMPLAHYLEKWSVMDQAVFQLDAGEFAYVQFDNGIAAVVENKMVRMLLVDSAYDGASALSITIGADEQTLIEAYGHPQKVINTPQGKIINYFRQRIAFYLRGGQVYAWSIYV